MVCPKCNKTNPDHSVRCAYCGQFFGENAPKPVDTSWKKEYRGTGKRVAGIIVGSVLLSTVFPLNLLFAASQFAVTPGTTANTVLGVIFALITAAALIVGALLLILSIVKLKKDKAFNAELTKRHEEDIKAEKEALEQQKLMQEQRNAMIRANQQPQTAFNAGTVGKMLFELNGTLSTLQVYEDRVLHIAKTTARSYVAGKFFNGTKEYFYEDLTNVQFREATKVFNGYLQFDYPGAVNISNSGFGGSGGNYNNENSFVFDVNVRAGAVLLPGEDPVNAANRVVSNAYRYIHDRIMEEKKAKRGGNVVVQQTGVSSAADELKKYSELLASGAITQEEYNEIKKKYL